jgi:opacity protein-like surface antigen
MRYVLLAAVILAAAIAPAFGARVVLPCALHQVFLDNLEALHGETVVAHWITSHGYLVEIVASQENGTVSVLVTAPGKMSCLAETGESFAFTYGCAEADAMMRISADK